MNITDTITEYGKLDSQLKSLKTLCDNKKDELKSYMIQNDLQLCTSDEYKVQLTKSERTTTNEDQILKIIQADWKVNHGDEPCPYEKTIVVLDQNALESALYHNLFSKELLTKLSSCTTTTETYALRCTKLK